MGTVVLFGSPLESQTDDFSENLNVIVAPLPEGYESITLDELYDIEAVNLQTLLTDHKLISSEKTTIGGNPAYKVISTYKQGRYNLKAQQIFILKNGKEYALTYAGTLEGYPRFLNTAEEMINSFEIIR